MKVSPNFDIRELVHPDIWEAHGERCIDFIHANLPITLEALKKNLSELLGNGKTEIITINNWLWGGNKKSSGLRHPDDDGAVLSTHKVGNGTGDAKFKFHTASEVYYHILNNQEKYPFIIRMENIEHTPTWLHIECGSERNGEIIIFNP